MANINDLSRLIEQELGTYLDSLKGKVDKTAKKIAQETVQEVKQLSPVRTGDYKQGWKVKKQKNGDYIVHNKTDYQLTHLLEKGHVNRDGSRTQGKEHIRPAEQNAIRKFEQAIREDVQS